MEQTERRHPVVIALAALVFAEFAVIAIAIIYLVFEIVTASAASSPTAVALTVLTAIAAIWLGVIGVNILRGRAWTRSATIVWQVLQLAVAIGCFQGLFAQPTIGWALLIPAVAGLVLVFTPPVVRAMKRD